MKKIQLQLSLFILTFMGFNTLQAADTVKMTELMYQEAAPGLGVYPYRILANDKFMRFDGGNDNDGYILYDRKNKRITSVNHEDQSRLIIQHKTDATYKNEKIHVEFIHTELEKSPQLQGKKAKMHEIVANENLCRQVLSFDGLLPSFIKAWKEYEDFMQKQNQATLSRTPSDMQTDCFITNNISHASSFLNFGLPYSIKSKDGTLRILQNYQQVEKPKLFVTPPSNYREFII